jgi:ABC-type methionine transport system ATPase subunit
VLADEPTGELDSKTGDEIYKILRWLQQSFQTTLVVVTHDRRFIMPDDLVLEIQDGQVVEGNEAVTRGSGSERSGTDRGVSSNGDGGSAATELGARAAE